MFQNDGMAENDRLGFPPKNTRLALQACGARSEEPKTVFYQNCHKKYPPWFFTEHNPDQIYILREVCGEQNEEEGQ